MKNLNSFTTSLRRLKERKKRSLLKAGFFNGSPEKLKECFPEYEKTLRIGGLLYIDSYNVINNVINEKTLNYVEH